MHQIMFYLFSTMALFTSLCVIISTNTIYSVLALVLTFIFTSCLWILLDAEFLAIGLILVYVGAVMVLFLFVVMMLDFKESSVRLKSKLVKYWPMTIVVPILLIIFLIYFYRKEIFNISRIGSLSYHGYGYNNLKVLGILLYTKYIFAIEVAAMLLLLGMVIAVSLTFRGRVERRYQDVSKQIHANTDSIKLLNIK